MMRSRGALEATVTHADVGGKVGLSKVSSNALLFDGAKGRNGKDDGRERGRERVRIMYWKRGCSLFFPWEGLNTTNFVFR